MPSTNNDIPELQGLPADEQARISREAITLRPGNIAWAFGVVLILIGFAVAATWFLMKVPKSWPWWIGVLPFIAVMTGEGFVVQRLVRSHTRLFVRRHYKRDA